MLRKIVWIESKELEEILEDKDRGHIPININLFKNDPLFSVYPCHKPIKIELIITIKEVL